MRAITIITYGNEYWEAKMTTTKKLPAWKTYEFPNQQANFMWNMAKTIQTHGIQTYRYSVRISKMLDEGLKNDCSTQNK